MAEQKLVEETKYDELEKIKIEDAFLDKIRDVAVEVNRNHLISISNYTVENEQIQFMLMGGAERIDGIPTGKVFSGELDDSTLQNLPFIPQTKHFIKNNDYLLILKNKVILNLLDSLIAVLRHASTHPEEEETDEAEEFEFTLEKEKAQYTKEQALEFLGKDKDGNLIDWKVKIINRVYAEV